MLKMFTIFIVVHLHNWLFFPDYQIYHNPGSLYIYSRKMISPLEALTSLIWNKVEYRNYRMLYLWAKFNYNSTMFFFFFWEKYPI
jgi:hypothetical protein